MIFHKFDPEAVIRHPYGMLEPDPACAAIAPGAVHLILVPGLLFDPEGWRLGYGGGFYDRYLSQTQGTSAGISYQSLLKTRLPHDSHDIPMQYIITENGISPTPYLAKGTGYQSI
jgi:5-formyltetrahydrofolate cyclo-ligase